MKVASTTPSPIPTKYECPRYLHRSAFIALIPVLSTGPDLYRCCVDPCLTGRNIIKSTAWPVGFAKCHAAWKRLKLGKHEAITQRHDVIAPWKINMEPSNHQLRKENDLANLHDDVPC